MSEVAKSVEFTIPVKDGSLIVGEVPIVLRTDASILINSDRLFTLAARLMRSEALVTVRNQLPKREWATISELKAAGLQAAYHETDMELTIHPTVEQRPRGEVMASLPSADIPTEALVKPAAVNGYVNVRTGFSHSANHLADTSATSIPPLGFDGAIRWLDIVFEGEGQIQPSGQWRRGGLRAVYDFPDDAIRFMAGDLNAGNVDLQGLPAILGVSVQRSYRTMQPSKNIRPTGRRAFRIERPSEVRVLVNGHEIRRLQLSPGEYDLDSLPLTYGSNDVQLKIRSDLGEEQTLDFNILYNHALLAPGTSEWAVAGGIQTQSGMRGMAYDAGEPAIMASYRLGIFENLTSEAALLAGARTAIGRTHSLMQTSAGVFLFEASASYDIDKGAGWQFRTDYQTAPTLLGEGQALGMSLETTSKEYKPYLSNPSSSNDRALRAGISYSQPLWENIAASLAVHYDFAREGYGDKYGGSVTLGLPLDNTLSASISANYESARAEIAANPSGFTLLGRLSWRPAESTSIALGYDPLHRVTTASVASNYTQGPSRWGVSLEAAHDAAADGRTSADNTLSGTAAYTDDRMEFNAYRGLQVGGLGTRQFTETNTVSVATALAFADDRVTVSRPLHGSFAIFAPHPNIANSEIRIAPNEHGYRSSTGSLGTAIVSDLSPYSPSRISYDIEGLPPGYDMGPGTFNINAPYKSAYALTVGSDATLTAGGTLYDAKGEIVALLAGEMRLKGDADKKVEIFTNGTGRFYATGLSPGQWEINMGSNPSVNYAVTLAPTENGVVELGDVRPQ